MPIPPTPAPSIMSEKAIEGTARGQSKSAAIGLERNEENVDAPRAMAWIARDDQTTTQP